MIHTIYQKSNISKKPIGYCSLSNKWLNSHKCKPLFPLYEIYAVLNESSVANTLLYISCRFCDFIPADFVTLFLQILFSYDVEFTLNLLESIINMYRK